MRFAAVCLLLTLASAALALEPITTVTLDENRAFLVNGKPFFPIMIWLQDPANFPKALDAGCNTVAGYWPQSGGTKDVVEYQGLVETAGLYGVMPFDARLKGNPALLGYIHDDEPDLSHPESDAQVVPAPNLRINNSTPLFKIVDGDLSSWSVLDPLEGARISIKLKQAVTIQKLAVSLTVSPGIAVAKDVAFLGADGAVIAAATLESKRGRQEIALPQPAMLSELTFEVRSTYPGEQVWGSIGEIEGFDAEGKNVLLSPPRKVPRQTPAETLAGYERIRAADPSRPVFMTLTASFMPVFGDWPEEQRAAMYPEYVKAADVLGFDIYPLYGWGRPDWIDRVRDGQAQLRELAGTRAMYQWIETSNGSQWVTDSDKNRVTPRHIRAEVWMSLCRGATAIGYFTHIWKPAYSQFGVPPENIAALREINEQITRLTPVLLSPAPASQAAIKLEGDLKADIMAREHFGSLYLFAVNYDPSGQGGKATITVEGLRQGTRIDVVDEDRILFAGNGEFTDRFDGLGVHIYRIL